MVVAERGEILRGERIIEKRDARHATSQDLRIKSNDIRIKETKGQTWTMGMEVSFQLLTVSPVT